MLTILSNLASVLGGPQSWGQFLVLIGLGYVVYLLNKNQIGQNKIASNHLHPLPEMLETLKRIEQKLDSNGIEYRRVLGDIKGDQEYIKAKLNGR